MSDEPIAKQPERRVYVLKAIEVDFKDLNTGDIFRLGKATPDDIVNEDQLYIAESNAEPNEEKVELSCSQINFIKTLSLSDLRLDNLPNSLQDIYDQLKQPKEKA